MERRGPIREDRIEGADPIETERRGPIREDRVEVADPTRRSRGADPKKPTREGLAVGADPNE